MGIEHDKGLSTGKLSEGLNSKTNREVFKAKLELEREKFSMPELGGERMNKDVAALEAKFAERLAARHADPVTADKPFSIKKG